MNKEEVENIDIVKLLLDFKNDLNVQKLKTFYNTKSFSEILKVERKEEPHSSFISWLLNENESHNLGDFAIKKLLDILLQYGRDKFTKELYEVLIIGNYNINNLYIKTEYYIKNTGRIDIFLSMDIKGRDIESIPINIIIENKVYSKENDKQTNKYYEHFENSSLEAEPYKKDINFYIYLTPISTIDLRELKEPECECKDFIQINYQILSDNIFELVANRDIPERTKFIVKEYLKSLGTPSTETEIKGKIMVLTEQEAELLEKFFEEHDQLLTAAIEARSMNPELDSDNRKKLKALNQVLGNTKRDLTKYSFNGKSNLGKGKLVLELVKQYVSDNPNITFSELKQELYFIRKTRVIDTLAIAKSRNENEKNNKKRYFTDKDDVITLEDGTKIAVYTGWSAGSDLDNIFEFADKNGYIIL